jgi:hypothetical protein
VLEGLGRSFPLGDLEWGREFLKVLCTMPAAASGTGKSMFVLEDVFRNSPGYEPMIGDERGASR